MKIYLIPGLGFDHRIFQKLDLGDHETHHLDWIEPEPDESFRKYADRMAKPIDRADDQTVLIGHSLGGMISQEIAQLKKVRKIILVSSIKSRDEMPLFFKMASRMAFHKLFTQNLTLKTFKHWGKNHDYVTPEEQDLFKNMVSRQSDNYLQWALMRLSQWHAPKMPQQTQVKHIHGDSDKTFPVHSIKAPVTIIQNAGHFMVYKHPDLISKIIRNELHEMT